MLDNKFLQIVKPKMTKTHKEVRFLRNKSDFIDDLLEKEDIYNIETSIKDVLEIPDNVKDEYFVLNRFVKALNGIDSQIFLERTRQERNIEETTDHNKLQRLQIDKIDLIKDLANWLFA